MIVHMKLAEGGLERIRDWLVECVPRLSCENSHHMCFRDINTIMCLQSQAEAKKDCSSLD